MSRERDATGRSVKQQLRNDLVQAALRWYRVWKQETDGEGPDESNGWTQTDIKLYGAARRYMGDK